MHILKFFESFTDQWVIDKTKNCDLPLSRLLEIKKKLLNLIRTLNFCWPIDVVFAPIWYMEVWLKDDWKCYVRS